MTPEELLEDASDHWAGSAAAQSENERNAQHLAREAGEDWECPECFCPHLRVGPDGPECDMHGTIGDCLEECDGYVVSGHACGVVANF